MNNSIIDMIVESLSAKLVSETSNMQISEERIHQYRSVFNDYDDIEGKIKEISLFSSVNHLFTGYTKDLLDSNELTHYQDLISIVPIESTKHSSIAYQIGNKSIVIIDIITMRFVWMMNKIFLWGFHNKLDATKLFVETMLHFGTLLEEEKLGFLYPQPKTPPHTDIENMMILWSMTQSQEKFILAHEISHLLLTENDISDNKNNFSSFLIDVIDKNDLHSLEEELAVDKMALYMVIKHLKKERSEKEVDIACENIFLLIRYFLWLRIAISLNGEGDRHTRMMLARNNQLRIIFRDEIGNHFLNDGVIQMLEYLEETLEPAALAVNDILKKHLNSP